MSVPHDPPVDNTTALAASATQAASGVSAATPAWWPQHVYALFALAIGAPLYGRLQRQTTYLVTLETVTICLFILLWTVVIPGVLLLVIAGLRRCGDRAGTIALNVSLATLITFVLLGIVNQRYWGGFGWFIAAGCIAGGVIAVRAYRRLPWLRSLLSVAAFGSLVLPVSLLMVFLRDSARPVVTQELTAHNPVPVVMVVFDCFSGVSLMNQDRLIDADRYPNFAKLAATSNWYRNCSSVHPRTTRAVPAILTGALPAEVLAPTVEAYPQNLFTLLKATGDYRLTSFEPFTLLCPLDQFRDRAAPDRWTQWIALTHTVAAVWLHDIKPWDLPFETPQIPRAWFGLEHVGKVDPRQREGVMRYSWDMNRSRQFQHFVDCVQPSEQPGIWFGHFAMPHAPWTYLPSGRQFQPDAGLQQEWGAEGSLWEKWADDDLVTLHAHQQHLLQQGYADLLVGRLIEHLRSVNLFDRCLLVVMADHGASFRRGQSHRLPIQKNLADIMSVPLFIKLPDQKTGDVLDFNSEITDVLPTILDVLKLTPPTPLEGQSLISPEFTERPEKRFTDDQQVFKVDGAFESRYDVLIEDLARFGTGADPLRLYKIGPHPELLGQPIDDLPSAGRSSIQIHPINFAATIENSPDTLVPVFLQAHVEGGSRPAQFAIAVNGTIWGTTRTYRVSYLRDFWRVMLPESCMKPAENHLRVFQIVDSPTGVTLSECIIGPTAVPPILPAD